MIATSQPARIALPAAFLAAILAATLPTAAPAAEPVIKGPAKALSGDVLEIAGRQVRLYGIDAPEPAQTCLGRKGHTQHCGRLATEALATLVMGHEVACRAKDRDSQGRTLAVCQVGPFDLNEQMVADGWALADPATGGRYKRAETFAKARKEGLWRGTFTAPWQWRAEHGAGGAAPPDGHPDEGGDGHVPGMRGQHGN